MYGLTVGKTNPSPKIRSIPKSEKDIVKRKSFI
jgi:hypothetical protein